VRERNIQVFCSSPHTGGNQSDRREPQEAEEQGEVAQDELLGERESRAEDDRARGRELGNQEVISMDFEKISKIQRVYTEYLSILEITGKMET